MRNFVGGLIALNSVIVAVTTVVQYAHDHSQAGMRSVLNGACSTSSR